MKILHPEWPPEEKYETRPIHKRARDIDIETLLRFLEWMYKGKCPVKFEYHLYNEKWKNAWLAWQKNTAKKIDCVVEISPYESDIIETDIRLLDETLGQLIVYRYWYEKQTGKRVRYAIALAKENQEQTAEVMKLHKIKIFIAKDDTFIEI